MLLAAGGAAHAQADTGKASLATTLYFYSPDWRPGNLNLLTESIESELGGEGLTVKFQAFARYEDLVERLDEQVPDFLLAPAWIGPTALPDVELERVAHPVRGGRSTYRKALMARPEIRSVADLARGTVAATVHAIGPDGARAVLDYFNLDGTTVAVLPVPKDVDALLALSFGQADAALVTSTQFETLSRVNPNVTRDLHVLAFSPEIELPGVYATPKVPRTLRSRMVAALAGLAARESGLRLLEQMGYDGMVAETGADAGADAEAAP
jgi:ABC-type phosphate/phosphonate transport system substrate-binding protein